MTQITKVGHFYMAQLGHYHVAATKSSHLLTKFYPYIILLMQSDSLLEK